MNFGQALHELKEGKHVTRSGWNGKKMFVYYVPEGFTEIDNKEVPTQPFISMFTAQETSVPWLASQSDLLSEDWEVL